MSRKTCPACNGKGGGLAFVDGGVSGMRFVRCAFCEGDRYVTSEQLQWRRDGQLIRDQRKTRQQTLRGRAAELGISMTLLSAAEQGKIDPTPYMSEEP